MKDQHPKKTYYPTYDVMSEKGEWDPITQQVIQNRTHPTEGNVLTPEMKRTLQAYSKTLFPSHVGEQTLSISLILDHRLTENKLKSYPKNSLLSKEEIILYGLAHAEEECVLTDQKPFFQMSDDERLKKIISWKHQLGEESVWKNVSCDLFYTTLTSELLKLIYSDPSVWSNIGYGGPAYPRGYYAYGPKQFDSWEAKPHDENLS
ncbi:gluconate 2-dehydrogenase subunit 3 family protein [Pontibacillus sp. HMF3514]|uniref:gluconate 2-dehydrogenase subunit 3 family protein n=1 Tax=Pontibacillus sp. HMF3514 TaxID=2692425 RepID=UPI00132043CB|nr:gluconate 2-dehydrogenase subunit 3 family protein [Pontibacillus sp. HMF3514]QHE51228.1 hypothetical protein GS400_03920 [Pontibacillus sp. HMF3514]